MASLRRILGIKWQDKITNVDVLKDSSMLSIHSLLMKQLLRWIGHVRRMDDGRIPKDIMFGELKEGKRKRGRPKLRYKDVIKRDLGRIDVEHTKWEALATDRKVWKSRCKKGVQLAEQNRISQLIQKREKRKAREREKETPLTYFSCPHCDQSFSIQRQLTTHLSISHRRRADWGKSYQRQRPVYRKAIQKPGGDDPPNTQFCCTRCTLVFETLRMLTTHLHVVHRRGIDLG